MSKKYKILKDVFGHSQFREFQEEIIDAILEKNDLLAILPTGGGKSLCYQLPALLCDGLVVVISPLIALMQDQIKALNELGLGANMINSMQSNEENAEVFRALKKGEVKFLYLAPERLVLGDFVQFLRGFDIAYFVIDEAHCVSGWGHEFRADYRNLGQLKTNFPHVPIVAFTATATRRVGEDIISSLNLVKPKLFRAKTKRDNLIISVQKRISNGAKQALNIVKKHPNQCGIIYTFTRKESERLAEFLNKNGLSTLSYHAGLSSEQRKKVYGQFAFENVQIVVATVAFGMGIDKSNIRFIIHTSLPKTLENYYQEIGRAGRDGEMSYVYLLYSKSDEMGRLRQIEDSLDEGYKQISKDKLRQMYRFCISSKCRHELIANYFEDDILPCESLCDNCTKGDVELVDISIDAKKLLSAIYRTNQTFGAGHIVDILRGSKGKRILELAHDRLSVYGIGGNLSKNQWHNIIDVLFDNDILISNEFKSLKITPQGFEVLKGKLEVWMPKDLLEIAKEESKKEVPFGVNEEIFEEFRQLRSKISNQTQVPAYIVFDDKALREISQNLPQNEEEFLKINGVGNIKLEKYGKDFISLAKKIKLKYKIPDTKLGKTHLETYKLLGQCQNIEELVKIRDLSENTIISHLNLLHQHHKINDENKEKLLSQIKIPENISSWIKEGTKMGDLKKLREYLYKFELLEG
ncbi:MAG: DNA helicase RecQ [Proteobacteria bacterium]|nr:MAG: DNA helicase RecQ [Pseudomonadota bacterium]